MIAAMRASFLALIAALCGPSAPSYGQTMEFACPDSGTTITFDSAVSVVARGQEGMDCKIDVVGGAPFKLRALLIANPSPDGANTSAFIAAVRPERLWPLKVGNKIEASFSAGGRSWDYVLTVARYEKRLGPGDALFDTFVVEMSEVGNTGQRSISRWWISPLQKYVIRFDSSDSNGRANRAVVTSIKH
jgi:hypothetical protein